MNAETYVESVVIDICSRSFFITSNENDERVVECDSAEEFMNVLEVYPLTRGRSDSIYRTGNIGILMEVFTLKEWEENFDELYTRVEKVNPSECQRRWQQQDHAC